MATLSAVDEWLIRGDHSFDVHTSALDKVRLSGPVDQSAVKLEAQLLPDGTLLLQWPEAASAFQLETSASVQGSPWSPVSLIPESSQGLKRVLLDAPEAPAFFRLRR